MTDRRTALVTGATGGIGAAIVRRLEANGFRVYAGGRNGTRLKSLASLENVVALPFDVTVEGEVERAREGVAQAGATPLDLVVNAAGVFGLAPVTQTPGALLARSLDVNLRGAFHVVRAFLPAMLDARAGLVVNVGSVAGRRAFPENSAYSASKFGLRGFHEVLLEEMRGTGVRACLLEPGAVDTPLWDPLDPDSVPHLPNRSRMLRPDDVARAVEFMVGLPARISVPLIQVERA